MGSEMSFLAGLAVGVLIALAIAGLLVVTILFAFWNSF